MFPSLRHVLLAPAVIFACAGASAGQEAAAETANQKIRRGVALHDQGRYQEAARLYREVLQEDENHSQALYELALSLNAYGDYAECAKVGSQALGKAKEYRLHLFMVTGSCYDLAGEDEKAVEIFQKGRQEFPEDSRLAFNFAVTQFQLNRPREARELAKVSIAGRPAHASSYHVLTFAYAADDYEIPALLAALRFLSLEPTGQRAPDVARLARKQLLGEITQPSDKEISVFLRADGPTDEGDFKTVNATLSLISAARFLPEAGKKTESEEAAILVMALLETLSESLETVKASPFVRQRLIEPLLAIRAAKLDEAFGYLAFYSLDLEGGKAWLEAHPDQRTALVQHLRQSAAAD